MRIPTAPHTSRGFTLVEMIVIAPIVILMIGAFIALIVNLTGEVMSSRGANVVTYELQDALNRIEDDVKLSTTYLATTNIDVTTNNQGYSPQPSATGGTTAFTNIDRTGATPTPGSSKSIILNALVTDGNPMSSGTGLIYLANKPNDCSAYETYSKNTPMTMNIVYFIDETDTLWRRVIMPDNYADTNTYCGTKAPWQLPTCSVDFTSSTFCKGSDERLLSGVTPNDFSVEYFAAASSTTPDPTASNPTVVNNDTRNTALQSTPTISVSITARKNIAGREIVRTGSLRATRLDSNASSIGQITEPTQAPTAPIVSGNVSDGHVVTFTWPRVSGAASYDIDYCIIPENITYSSTYCDTNSAWVTGATDLSNNNRIFEVSQGEHTDRVEARVRAYNSFGPSTYGKNLVTIPLWAPLLLKGNWTDYQQGYSTAAYTRTKSGLVVIKGMVDNPTSPGGWDVIGTLPTDYAPTDRLIYGVSRNSNTIGRVDVDPTPDGVNILHNPGASTGWVSLETIRYVAANAGYSRTTPTLLNGYSQYGGSYAPVTYTQISSGRVVIEGLANNGTRTDGTDIFTIPAALAPPQYLHISSEASGFSHIGVVASPSVVEAKGTGGSGYYPVNLNYLPGSASVTWSNMSLVNGWVDYGGQFATAQYTKDSDNIVQLKGLIRAGSTSAGSTIATLPAGFRPKERILYTTVGNTAYGRIDILPDGRVLFMVGSSAWTSLDGITFVANS